MSEKSTQSAMSETTPLLVEIEEQELSELVLLRLEVAKLTKEMVKLTSFKNRLMNGMLQGFSVVIGGTLVAWIVVSLTLETLKTVNYIPVINTVFESEQAKHLLQKLSELQHQLE